jgi:hypothetical protein
LQQEASSPQAAPGNLVAPPEARHQEGGRRQDISAGKRAHCAGGGDLLLRQVLGRIQCSVGRFVSSRGVSVDPSGGSMRFQCLRVWGLRRRRDGPAAPLPAALESLSLGKRRSALAGAGRWRAQPTGLRLCRGRLLPRRLLRLTLAPAAPPSSSSAAASLRSSASSFALRRRSCCASPTPPPPLCSRTVENGPTELHREAAAACARGRTRERGRHGRMGQCREGGSTRRRRLRAIPLVKHTKQRAADCERDSEVMQMPIVLERGFDVIFYFLPIQNVL